MGVHDCSRFLLVKVITDDGIVGIGEATLDPLWSGESQGMAKVAIDEILAPWIVGQDPLDIQVVLARMDRVLRGNPFTKAAIDMALYDILGKATGLPLYRLLGGKVRERVRLKCSVSAADAEQAAEMAEHFASLGIQMLKIKVGTNADDDVRRVAAVRRAVGNEIILGVDANGGWTVTEAISILRRMEPFGLAFAEQPVPAGNVHWMAAVRRAVPMPIVADESVFTASDAVALVQHEAADVFNIYPGKNGGISGARRIASIAESAGCKCLVGSNLELGVATAAMAHFACATLPVDSEAFGADIIGPLYHEQDVIADALGYQNGYLCPPEEPGLGVQLDEDRIRRLRA